MLRPVISGSKHIIRGCIEMKSKDFYNIIFKRKSIRKYNLESLDPNVFEGISTYINIVKPMYEDIKVEIKIVTQETVKTLFPIKTPYYILISSENKVGCLINVGFMLQQVDLFLSENEISSCWVGTAQPKKEIVNESELEYVIALAFGSHAENLHRENVLEFKRKANEEIRDTNQKDEFIESVLLAPSATNSQPWFFRIDADKIHAYCIKSSLVKAILYKKMNQILV